MYHTSRVSNSISQSSRKPPFCRTKLPNFRNVWQISSVCRTVCPTKTSSRKKPTQCFWVTLSSMDISCVFLSKLLNMKRPAFHPSRTLLFLSGVFLFLFDKIFQTVGQLSISRRLISASFIFFPYHKHHINSST